MKTLEDVLNWLTAIKEFAANAPEGVSVGPVREGHTYRYKLENVNPEATKEFMKVNSLVESQEHGKKVSFFESESICVLDFEYPFPRPMEECKTPRERLFNIPKLLRQSNYRLVWRKQKA